jgi:DHA1 family tetracycline resistance protein-like MFS transporter
MPRRPPKPREVSLTRFIRNQVRSTLGVLSGFHGNPRACLIAEPLWVIPFTLYSTYASVYMLALGCSVEQIGLISSISLALQTVFSLASGFVTDRLGRRRTTLIFDLISWSIPTLLWAFARNFTFFLLAGIINSLLRIVANSWSCLMIEDARPQERVHVFTWISVAGILAGFISPVAGLLVGGFGLVPAMRGLYIFAFLSMTFMNLFRNSMVTETRVGLAKLRESRHADPGATLREYSAILAHLARSPLTILAFLISILMNVYGSLRATFLSILLTRGLGFPAESIAIFPAATSVVMLIVFLFVMPSVAKRGTARPLLVGLSFYAAGSLLLTFSPMRSFFAVMAGMIIAGVGSALAIPLSDTFVANTVVEKDRAKAMSLFYTVLFAVSAPFGYLGGVVSAISDRVPFVIATAALVASVACAGIAAVIEAKQAARPASCDRPSTT